MDGTVISAELPDLDSAAPAGPDLVNDAAFGELERAALGKPEKQYGGTVIPAEPPNWKEVAAAAADLLDRTRDLRVLVHLAVARLNLAGLSEFAAVIGMIRYLLAERWDFVHPRLDPDDDNDPTERANALVMLAEPIRVIRVLRDMPLAVSPRDGPVSWRAIGLFNGSIEAGPAVERKTEPVIRAAFAATGAEALASRQATIERCLSDVAGIGTAFDTHSGFGNSPDLMPLSKLLNEMARYIVQFMPAGDPAVESDAEHTPAEAGAPVGGAAAPQRAAMMSVTSFTSVGTRSEAMHLLDLVCRYYEQHEPSSPLPLLIGRARSLADKGFLEIMQDLAPDGVSQAQLVVKSREQY